MLNFNASSSVSWPEDRSVYLIGVWEADYGSDIVGIFEYESEANLVASRIREKHPSYNVTVSVFPINKDMWIDPYERGEEEDKD